MAREFFDDDLIDSGTVQSTPPSSYGDKEPVAPSVHSQKRQELPDQVSQATDELERLKQRQENLERRKQDLIDQRRRIEAFEKNRREMREKLGRSAVLVVREGGQASRMAALCEETGALFSRLHQEMDLFAPEKWTEEEYDTRLTEALAQIESAGSEYSRAINRINALGWSRGDGKGKDGGAAQLNGDDERRGPPATFMEWLWAGLAFTLPLVILLILAFLLHALKGQTA